MVRSLWHRLWKQELGFTLLEVVLATFIVSTTVVGSVVVLGVIVRTSSDTGKNLGLQDLVLDQIETIQNATFNPDGVYPIISDIPGLVPDHIALAVTVENSGTNYRYPNPDGALVTNVVQKVTVSASDGKTALKMTFYKIEE